ncbi:MAG: TolC family protein, partial [Candidatus Aminicenantales bacterium]
MKRNILLIGLSALLLLGGAAPAQQAANGANVLNLTLDETIVRALKHNVALLVAELTPQSSALSVKSAQEIYYPTLGFNVRKQNSESASYSFLDVAGTSNTTKTTNYSAQVNQLTPIGGTFSIAMTDTNTDTTQKGETVNPRYNTQLSFSYTQPLLQNFGYDISRYNILVARNGLATSDSQLKQTLLDTIYSVESAYWALVYSIENLSDKQYSVQLAKDLLEKNQRSVEVGIMAPMDVLTAEAEIATREADLIQAETQVKSAEDQLKVLLNMPEDEQRAIGSIKALDSPDLEERKVSLDEALATAFQLRADLATSKLG